jgi:hypothetical protein
MLHLINRRMSEDGIRNHLTRIVLEDSIKNGANLRQLCRLFLNGLTISFDDLMSVIFRDIFNNKRHEPLPFDALQTSPHMIAKVTEVSAVFEVLF